MRFPFSPRTSRWRPTVKKSLRKGSASLVAVFLFLIFSALGLSLTHLSQIYLRICAFRKNVAVLEYAAENGVKEGLSYLLDLTSKTPTPRLIPPLRTEALRETLKMGSTEILGEMLGTTSPLVVGNEWGDMFWTSDIRFKNERIVDGVSYFLSIHRADIVSVGKIKRLLPKRESSLELRLGILCGNIPLSFFPFLLDQKLESGRERTFLEDHNISFVSKDVGLSKMRPYFSEGGLLPQETGSLAAKALKIKLLRPEDFSLSLLRRVLGLEQVNEPVPEGVYLVKDDLGLGGVYVQGDVDRMTLAIEDEHQVVSFETANGRWVLRFSPSRIKTIFNTPQGNKSFDLIPLGIILVSGKIHSLGGGALSPSGEPFLIKDQEVPSLLNGVSLTIVASDEVTLSSHLIHQGLRWVEGIPYLKDSKSELFIFSAGKDFLDGSAKDGGVVIGGEAPPEMKIQGSITAAGKGFQVKGAGKKIDLVGGLQVSGLDIGRNNLNIFPHVSDPAGESLPSNAPLAAKPLLHLAFLEALEWREIR